MGLLVFVVGVISILEIILTFFDKHSELCAKRNRQSLVSLLNGEACGA